MKFTEQDLARQREEFSRLCGELAGLNARFESQKKAFGLPEGQEVEEPSFNMTPALRAAMDESRERAEHAGREAADRLRHALAPSSETAAASSPRMRRGAIRI